MRSALQLVVLAMLASAAYGDESAALPATPPRSTAELAESIAIGPAEPAPAKSDEMVKPTMALFGAQTPRVSGAVDGWELLPQGLIYRTYLAGVKESRIGGVWNYDNGNGRILDVTLGGQAPLVRYNTGGGVRPAGWQIGMEGAGQVRLDRDEHSDVDAADYRFGVPITWGDAIHQTKFAFYHLSSHLGDEFLLKHPGFPRLNYSENVFVYGHSIYPVQDWRAYAEVGYGFIVDVAEPWQFQYGLEWAPETWTGFRGAPFFAVNAYQRQEVDFGGNLVFQTGWAWRRNEASGLFRVGVQYYNGKNEQFSLFNSSEQKTGLGIWYDY